MSLTPYWIKHIDQIPSPGLLVFHDMLESNIDHMIMMAGAPTRLVPHIKTHKMAAVVQMQMNRGISRFKCATLAEAEMLAQVGVEYVLLAYQLNTPMTHRFAKLQQTYPNTTFAVLVDNDQSALNIQACCHPQEVRVFIDINVGMNRTGIPIDAVLPFYERLRKMPGIHIRGFHVYDGHIRDTQPEVRQERCDAICTNLEEIAGAIPDALFIMGGSPTFGQHVQRRIGNRAVWCSPGTSVFWDAGYQQLLPEYPFEPAALLLTRVLSKPSPNLLTLDLGHKAIAAENPLEKRAIILGLESAIFISQSEEHLVIQYEDSDSISIGDAFLVKPWHICPTVALYNEAYVLYHGLHIDTWPITRQR
jgi:D-serine deaminase-like pyridoxal phosphate-dependent protein